MDDTSCTNRYGFLLLVILGIDEHKLSQLVAFAFIRNHTMEKFVDSLTWFRRHLVFDDSNERLSQTAKAFVVDRHES
jgi:hypothetical protein